MLLDEPEVREVVLDVEHLAVARPRLRRGRRAGQRRRRAASTGACDQRAARPRTCCPRPTALSTRRLPPIASTRCLDRASPRPVPSTALRLGAQAIERREQPRRACRRRSRARCRRPRIRSAARRRGLAGHASPCRPRRLYLTAFDSEVQQHLLQALPVGQHVQRRASTALDAQVDARVRRRAAARDRSRCARARATGTGSSDSWQRGRPRCG